MVRRASSFQLISLPLLCSTLRKKRNRDANFFLASSPVRPPPVRASESVRHRSNCDRGPKIWAVRCWLRAKVESLVPKKRGKMCRGWSDGGRGWRRNRIPLSPYRLSPFSFPSNVAQLRPRRVRSYRTRRTYRHIITGGRDPLEEEYAPGCHLNRHEHDEHPAVRVERLQKRRRRDDARPLRHQYRDSGLRKRNRFLEGRITSPRGTFIWRNNVPRERTPRSR